LSEPKISIIGRNDNHHFTEKEYVQLNNGLHFPSTGKINADKRVRIVFAESAVKQLFKGIRWGSRYRSGDVECGGILIGKYYRDTSNTNDIIWAEVKHVIPADPLLVNATYTTLDITMEAWRKMYDDAAEYRAENHQIVGWYHTHLNSIAPRFSGVDVSTQQKFFTYEYSFGVVFNPNQCRWSAYYGPESTECLGELLLDEEILMQYRATEKPQIQIVRVNGDSRLQENGSVVHLGEEESVEEEVLSLGQLVGQFVSGVQKLWNTKKRRNVESPNPAFTSSTDYHDWQHVVAQNTHTPQSNPVVPNTTTNRLSSPVAPSLPSIVVSVEAHTYSPQEGGSAILDTPLSILNAQVTVAALENKKAQGIVYHAHISGELPELRIDLCSSEQSNARVILCEEFPDLSTAISITKQMPSVIAVNIEYVAFLYQEKEIIRVFLIIIEQTEKPNSIEEDTTEITGGNYEH